uniref:Uncharacterized protein n=1 Tax=Arundo donax TaxID=35708 RepID=A0A0A9BGD0_ARUDO
MASARASDASTVSSSILPGMSEYRSAAPPSVARVMGFLVSANSTSASGEGLCVR